MGIQTEQIGQSGVTFDLGNTGAINAQVGWITPGEGFLVHLKPGATTISNGSELFGSATVLPNGHTAPDGFAALSAFAQQGATVIDSSNPIFNELQVWVDTGAAANQSQTNAVSAPTGTLFTLSQLNIESLSLTPTVINKSDNGNTIGLLSSYTTTDGKTHEMADVWLASTDTSSTSVNQLTQALSDYASGGSKANLSSGYMNQTPSTNNDSSKLDTGNVSASALANTSKLSVLSNVLSQYDQNGKLIAGLNTSLEPLTGSSSGINGSGAGVFLSSSGQITNSANSNSAMLAKSSSAT